MIIVVMYELKILKLIEALALKTKGITASKIDGIPFFMCINELRRDLNKPIILMNESIYEQATAKKEGGKKDIEMILELEKTNRLSKTIKIEYDNPYADSVSGLIWLCARNIQMALNAYCPNANIAVEDIDD